MMELRKIIAGSVLTTQPEQLSSEAKMIALVFLDLLRRRADAQNVSYRLFFTFSPFGRATFI